MRPVLHLAEETSEPEKAAEWALREVDTGSRVAALEGRTGAGRSRVVSRLREAVDVAVVEPPPLRDGDAVFHLLAQLAAAVDGAVAAFETDATVRGRAAAAAKRLAAADRLLVLRLPSSWWGLDAPGRQQLVFRRRALAALEGLRQEAALRIVVLATRVDRAVERALGLHGHVGPLSAPGVRLSALRDEEGWGAYAPHARRAAELLAAAPPVTPVEARLAVGCLALGVEAARTARAIASSSPIVGLLDTLGGALRAPDRAPLATGLAAAAAARRPMRVDRAVALAGLPEEHAVLLEDCVGYRTDGGDLRLTEPVRLALARPTPSAHGRLADHYRESDGALSPACLDAKRTLAWLEKVHHLAHAGADRGAEWEAQVRGARELFWDRGRALSIEQGEFEKAAAVYRACVERFPDDAYAWHYLGYNLDRAGIEPLETEGAFRKAVALETDNRWWRSRLVTFLVEQARYDDAEAATREALGELDADGVRVRTDADLARDFHRWVATAWLEAGEVARARAALDLVPDEVVARDDDLRALLWRLADAEEAAALGDSVHPPGAPMALRWRRPTHLAKLGPGKRRLISWFPARVVDATEAEVVLVVGVVTDEQRELRRTVLTAAEWEAGGGWCPSEEASGYLYLARYEGGALRLYARDEPTPPWQESEPDGDALRHLRAWAAEHAAAE
jgi:tetratricopeptide (TPR) repeat protein